MQIVPEANDSMINNESKLSNDDKDTVKIEDNVVLLSQNSDDVKIEPTPISSEETAEKRASDSNDSNNEKERVKRRDDSKNDDEYREDVADKRRLCIHESNLNPLIFSYFIYSLLPEQAQPSPVRCQKHVV